MLKTTDRYPIRRALVCQVLWAIVYHTLPYDHALALLNPGELRALGNIFDIVDAEEAAAADADSDTRSPQGTCVIRPPWA
jgi:hypothetical protein